MAQQYVSMQKLQVYGISQCGPLVCTAASSLSILAQVYSFCNVSNSARQSYQSRNTMMRPFNTVSFWFIVCAPFRYIGLLRTN
jgi:hypothetical protein